MTARQQVLRAGRCALIAWLAISAAACVTQQAVKPPSRRPADVRAEIARRMPAGVADRAAWASDIAAALAALQIDASTSNLCATIAVIDQESNFTVDPTVAGLGRIARAEIDRRADAHHIPQLLVRAALAVKSSNGKSYAARIASVRSEHDLSRIYEDFISRVPLGQRLFADANPVRTAGPMQVQIGFAEAHARGYPYPVAESIRHEVFTRRGGVYFGIDHLLGYAADYDRPLYRFADFNAGRYASRNAALQNALTIASGIALDQDGDLLSHDDDTPGATELAARTLAKRLDLDDADIHRALQKGDGAELSETAFYRRTMTLADGIERCPAPRALVPRIVLKSPKITRKLTTEWYATRVDQRYQRCMAASRSAAVSR